MFACLRLLQPICKYAACRAQMAATSNHSDAVRHVSELGTGWAIRLPHHYASHSPKCPQSKTFFALRDITLAVRLSCEERDDLLFARPPCSFWLRFTYCPEMAAGTLVARAMMIGPRPIRWPPRSLWGARVLLTTALSSSHSTSKHPTYRTTDTSLLLQHLICGFLAGLRETSLHQNKAHVHVFLRAFSPIYHLVHICERTWAF